MLQPDVGGAFEPYEFWSDVPPTDDAHSVPGTRYDGTDDGDANHSVDTDRHSVPDCNSASNPHANDRSHGASQSDGDAIGGTNGYSHTWADLTLHPR